MGRSSEESGGGAERSRSGGAFAWGGQGILIHSGAGVFFARLTHPMFVVEMITRHPHALYCRRTSATSCVTFTKSVGPPW